MPEGDTVYLTARRLRDALAGAVLTHCDIRVPAYAEVDLTGERVDEVVSRGKHLLIRVGAWTIHSHLKMEGSWRLYRPGERWTRPGFEARAVLGTEQWVAVGFNLGELDVVSREAEAELVGHLGPDLLGPDWDAAEAARRLAEAGQPVAVALLDQRNLAGLGNVYANELCFLRGVLPTRPITEIDIPAMVTLAHRLILANRDRSQRATTGNLRRGQRLWVYGREGERCLRCGTRIRRIKLGRNELEERDTYFCPHCQT